MIEGYGIEALEGMIIKQNFILLGQSYYLLHPRCESAFADTYSTRVREGLDT